MKGVRFVATQKMGWQFVNPYCLCLPKIYGHYLMKVMSWALVFHDKLVFHNIMHIFRFFTWAPLGCKHGPWSCYIFAQQPMGVRKSNQSCANAQDFCMSIAHDSCTRLGFLACTSCKIGRQTRLPWAHALGWRSQCQPARRVVCHIDNVSHCVCALVSTQLTQRSGWFEKGQDDFSLPNPSWAMAESGPGKARIHDI